MTPEQERIAALEAHEQDSEQEARRHREDTGEGLSEGMQELSRLLGGPEGIAKINREQFWRGVRQKAAVVTAVALPVILVVLFVLAVVFGWR